MSLYNTQTAYEAIRAWFSRPEAERAVTSEGPCVYHGISEETGNLVCCAIGCLIPPALYDPNMEKSSLFAALSVSRYGERIENDILGDCNMEFLTEAQNIHDRTFNEQTGEENSPDIIVRDLDLLALEFKLTPVIEQN